MQDRKEEKLEKELIGLPKGKNPAKTGLTLQGFHVEKRTERFKSGKPDLRIGRKDFGQLDVELKYLRGSKDEIKDMREIPTGMTKLQWLCLRTYNEHGIPAVCLIYVECYDQFWLTVNHILRRPLRWNEPCVLPKLPSPMVIDGEGLFETAKEYLKNVGY